MSGRGKGGGGGGVEAFDVDGGKEMGGRGVGGWKRLVLAVERQWVGWGGGGGDGSV